MALETGRIANAGFVEYAANQCTLISPMPLTTHLSGGCCYLHFIGGETETQIINDFPKDFVPYR